VFVLPVVLVAVAMRVPFSGLSRLSAGPSEYVLLSLLIPAVVFMLYPHAGCVRVRAAMIGLLAVSVIGFSVRPFLSKALVSNRLSGLTTYMYEDVCMQSTAFTCGPASAVTALRKLGVNAHEGSLALAAHSTPVTGTPEDQLVLAINDKYGSDGIDSSFRRFDSVLQLKDFLLTVVPVRITALKGHYVTVLNVTNDLITIGDPAYGRKTMTHANFAKMWKFSGITLNREIRNSNI
jgi:predicted double-glycine peptidase